MNNNQENKSPTGNANQPLAMNRQQAEVFALLQDFSSDRERFHEWYQGALEVLVSNSPDKIAQVAHSIRELCDRLPKRIANIPEFKSPVSAAKPLGPQFLEIKQQFYTDGWKGDINKPLDAILIRFENIFSEPPRKRRFGQALTATDPQTEFLSAKIRRERDEAFEEIVSFFQNVTHHNRLSSEADFREILERFESILLNYLTPCTASQQNELKALIVGGPTADALNKVKELVSLKGANYVFFFEKLDNADWLRPLEQQGHFDNLPVPEPMKDGQFAYRIHVPLISLIKLAEAAPKEVTSILANLKLPDNSRVGDQVLQCMAKIRDAACIPKLRPLVQQLSENPSRTSWLWIQELLKNWIELNAISDVLALTEGYLIAAVDLSFNEFSDHHNTWLTKQIDERVLEPLTTQRPGKVVSIVCKALNRWEERNRQKHSKSDYWENSSSTYWLEDFKNPPQHHRELEGSLAARLFKAGEQVYRHGDNSKIAELDQLLRGNQSALFARLRWQLYADFPSHALEQARRDAIARMSKMSRADCGHNYEFAQMLHAHAKLHGASFLSPEEVSAFFATVFSGPLDVNGEYMKDYADRFRLKQLWPISALLQGKELDLYRAISLRDDGIKLEDYKPFRSGGGARMVQHVPPKEAEHLASMAMPELWTFLNDWQPKGRTWPEWWVEEDFDALATKFAEFIENQPERFDPADKWWEHLRRPVLLYKFLDRVSKRIERKPEQGETLALHPTEQDWANWLGVAKWTTLQRPIAEKKENDELDWTWARIVVATFLQVVLRSKYQLPEVYLPDVKALLKDLIHEEDPRLNNRVTAGMGDWLTTAINSVRGDALEALLQLALNQKNAGKEIDPWIFETIRARLELPTESPAVFALLGSKLCILIHLFESHLRERPALLFPSERPSHQRAAIVAHFGYDHPWNKILQIFPDLIKSALKILKAMHAEAKDDEAKESRRDFGSQLGTNIACYYWNGAFASDAEGEKALDYFFAHASRSTRAIVIGQIATIWEKPSKDAPDKNAIARVMRIWERRLADIVESLRGNDAVISNFEQELAAFTHYLGCECFPFGWRVAHTKQALEQLQKTPDAYHLFGAIYEFGVQADRLESMLQLLRLMLTKPSNQLRWSIQSEKLRPILLLGSTNEEPRIKNLAEECRDLLLRMGFSEFLNLGNDRE